MAESNLAIQHFLASFGEHPMASQRSHHLMTICYEPARLVVTTIPKSGSTTLIAAFLLLAGFRSEAPRHFIRQPGAASRLSERGLAIKLMGIPEIKYLRAKLQEYSFLTIMRDPAQRLLSGYFNKINRYCKRFERHIYVIGKLHQFLQGPGSWGDINCGNRFMRKFISFEDILTGLERNGTGWDRHFASQSILAGTEQIEYNNIVRVENLGADLTYLLARRGMRPEVLEKLRRLQRFNATEDVNRQTLLTDSNLERIKNLYQKDYEFLQWRACI